MIQRLAIQAKNTEKRLLVFLSLLSLLISFGVAACIYRFHLPMALEAPMESFKDRIMGLCTLMHIPFASCHLHGKILPLCR